MSRDSLALRTEMAHERNLILTDDIFSKEWCSLYSPVVKNDHDVQGGYISFLFQIRPSQENHLFLPAIHMKIPKEQASTKPGFIMFEADLHGDLNCAVICTQNALLIDSFCLRGRTEQRNSSEYKLNTRTGNRRNFLINLKFFSQKTVEYFATVPF